MLARAVLALRLLSPPEPAPEPDHAAQGIDPVILDAGLRVRVGEAIDDWQIEIRATELRGTYEVTLRGPDHGEVERRQVNLVGQTDEDRSRELASLLAVIIEESIEAKVATAKDPEPDPEPEPQPEPEPEQPEPQPRPLMVPRAAISWEGHVGAGPLRDPDIDLGVGLGVAGWLVRDHLQPRVRAWWSRSSGEDLRVDGVSVGAGLAAGAPIGHWWVGVLALPVFKWTRAESIRPATVLAGGGELTALVQYRRPWLVIGLRTGVETTFRPLRILGNNDAVRWGPFRWLLVLEVGLGLGRHTIGPRPRRRA